MNCIMSKKLPLEHRLTAVEKQELLRENAGNNYSYWCLLNERLHYHTTVYDLLTQSHLFFLNYNQRLLRSNLNGWNG